MPYDIVESKAFVETVVIEPRSSGVLTGLQFAVKDLIDLGGYKTSCGNPTWRDTHPKAATNADAWINSSWPALNASGKRSQTSWAFGMNGGELLLWHAY